MVGAHTHRQFLVISLEDMVDLPLKFLASCLEDQILVAVPTCQFLILPHLLLLLLAGPALEKVELGGKVPEEADHSE